MPRWIEDDVDVACTAWAYQWIENFANGSPFSNDWIGSLGCTLGRVRELHDGASSKTERDSQRWPEVFRGSALLVAVALQAMSRPTREVIYRHYVERWYEPTRVPGAHGGLGTVVLVRKGRPTKQHIIAERMGLSLAHYHHLRDTAKQCVRTVLCVDTIELARVKGAGVESAQYP